jgi:predicted transcriptional regulator
LSVSNSGQFTRATNWLRIAQDIDAELKGQVYVPTPEELEGIDRGLRDAAEGRFATEDEVEAVFAKFRGR